MTDEPALPAANEANTDGDARFHGFECINLGNGNAPWRCPRRAASIRTEWTGKGA